MDGCGESTLGTIFRRAVQEKLDHCPFSERARTDFQIWIAQTEAQFNEQRRRYPTEHGKLPDRLPADPMTCKERTSTPDALEFRKQLLRYEWSEITADDIIPGRCDEPPVAP